jgi:hypothetical protein
LLYSYVKNPIDFSIYCITALIAWKIQKNSTCAVGFDLVISITFSPPASLKTQRSFFHLPLRGRQKKPLSPAGTRNYCGKAVELFPFASLSTAKGKSHLSLRSLRLCSEHTIFMEQQN